jgi:hypothetical protein
MEQPEENRNGCAGGERSGFPMTPPKVFFSVWLVSCGLVSVYAEDSVNPGFRLQIPSERASPVVPILTEQFSPSQAKTEDGKLIPEEHALQIDIH